MRVKWKAEIWIEDNPIGEGVEHLSQREIDVAIEAAKRAIETEWEYLKVIDSDAYIEPEQTWDITSESMPNMKYHVKRYVRNDTERFECTCPDYLFRKHECEHIKKVKKQLAGERQKNKLFAGEEQ